MGLAEDKARFAAAVAKRRAEGPPPGFLDDAGHERVARAVVEANPDLVELKDYLALVRVAEQAVGKGKVSTFWLANRIGQLVRGEA